jgi:CDP-diacylglycerol--glycerol-3-phosphate 3-phosphatidyltransferase/cardiolipin synthase
MGIPNFQVGLAIYYIAAILTIVSMVIYLRAAWPVLTREG